ncbi:MAG TPA: hypothetical protein VGM51_09560 [Armatimonadota bacterium]|jgi:hypothetical protein
MITIPVSYVTHPDGSFGALLLSEDERAKALEYLATLEGDAAVPVQQALDLDAELRVQSNAVHVNYTFREPTGMDQAQIRALALREALKGGPDVDEYILRPFELLTRVAYLKTDQTAIPANPKAEWYVANRLDSALSLEDGLRSFLSPKAEPSPKAE